MGQSKYTEVEYSSLPPVELPPERLEAEKWWNQFERYGSDRMDMVRMKLGEWPFEHQDEYFPDAVFELERSETTKTETENGPWNRLSRT